MISCEKNPLFFWEKNLPIRFMYFYSPTNKIEIEA